MLTERKGTILKAIVGEYIVTANPVASDTIVRRHGLGVSSATVRNEMVDLEEDGYITRPHTSAGRVPLDKGYRYYVSTLPETIELPVEVRERARHQLSQAGRDPEGWIKMATSVLARLVENMAVITFPKAPMSRLRHLEVTQLQEFLAMIVVVLQETKIRQRLISLQEPTGLEGLTAAAHKLNAELTGLGWQEMESKRLELSPFEVELVETVIHVMQEEDRLGHSSHFVDGLSYLMTQPEFSESQKLREIVACLEDETLIHVVLEDVPEGGIVKVQIGGENMEDALRHLSVVVCRYGVSGEAAGAMAVVGPTRMAYPRVIGGVKYLSAIMDKQVVEAYGRPS